MSISPLNAFNSDAYFAERAAQAKGLSAAAADVAAAKAAAVSTDGSTSTGAVGATGASGSSSASASGSGDGGSGGGSKGGSGGSGAVSGSSSSSSTLSATEEALLRQLKVVNAQIKSAQNSNMSADQKAQLLQNLNTQAMKIQQEITQLQQTEASSS